MEQSSFMPVESTDNKVEIAFCVFLLHFFPPNSFLLYFTKVLVHNRLGKIKNLPFASDN